MRRLVALGRLALLENGTPLAQSAARARNLALLALLARAGMAGVSREKLSALLWSESDAERARHSLDQAIYELRRTLGADAFVSGATTLALNPDILDSDVMAFMRALEDGQLETAADLYTGPFLDGFHLPRSAEFERWVEGERAELHTRYAAALETLSRDAAAAEQSDRAIDFYRRLCVAEPFNARAALGLMKTLDAGGNRTGALQVAAEHEALIRRELEAPPDPSILDLADRLRREPERSSLQDPAVEPAAPATRPGTDTQARSTGAPDSTRTSPTHSPPSARRPIGFRLLLLASMAGVVAVVVAAVMSRSRVAGPNVDRPRVVVEPFRNETGDAALDAMSRLAADWIAEGMVRTGLVEVLEPGPGTRSAQAVVSGRVYGSSDTVRLQAKISRSGTGEVLRALDAVSAPADDLSEALEPLRQQVLGALGTLYDPRLAAWSETSLRPPTFAAYQQFAAGLELHAVPRDLPGAQARFRAALELDPDYVMPRLWLAWSAIMVGDWVRADSECVALQAWRERMSPVERAWHDRMLALVRGDNEASFRAAREMVALAPRSGWVISLANAALDTNRPAVAIDALLSAGIENLGLEREHGWFLLTAAYHEIGDYSRELDVAGQGIREVGFDWGFGGPGVSALAALGRVHEIERRLDELRDLPVGEDGAPRAAGALLNATMELRAHGFADSAVSLVGRELETATIGPANDPLAAMANWTRLQIVYEAGRVQDARHILNAMHIQPGDFRGQAMAGLLAARAGDAATAQAIITRLDSLDEPFLFGEPMLWRARIEAVLGQYDAAIASLRSAFARGQGGEAWHLVHGSRDFDPLRGLDSFRDLVRPRS